jgi:DNA-directed RNA polymerase
MSAASLTHLTDAQLELEDVSIAWGAKRYHEKQENITKREGPDKREDVAKLVRGAIPTLAEAIGNWIITQADAKGRKPAGYHAIALLGVDLPGVNLLAQLTLSQIFRSLPKGGLVVDIITNLGRRVEVEIEARALEEANPQAFKRFLALAERTTSEKFLERKHTSIVASADVALQWSKITQAGVGKSLLALALICLREVFYQDTQKQGIRSGGEVAVRLTDEAATVLGSISDGLALARPSFPPMLVPPRPWTSLSSGCYHDVRLSKLVPLVRTFSGEHKKLLKAAIADGSMQEVLDAVNAMQETRWAIDTRVLEAIKWCREAGHKPSRSFPASRLPALPKKIDAVEWAQTPQDVKIAMSRKRKTIRDLRSSAAIDASILAQDIATAEFLAGHEAFYLPHSLDFRGRVYAVPYFNHQRSDHIKGLFRFADGVPLGERGGEWLMIHLANCGDFGKISKRPFPERLAWVKENEEAILKAAQDPQGSYDWWSKADSPFCFLQACFEYDEWALTDFSPWYVSRIPVAADGSCSGLQHYSAITRSAEEAHHVNLTPREDVGDIYQVVADRAIPTLEEAASNALETPGRLAAIILRNGFGRSEVKRNVMTYFYGSGKFGMRDQHMEDTMRPLADDVALGELEKHPYAVMSERTDKDTGEVMWALDGGYNCAQHMAAHTYQAIVTVAPMADEAASWVRKVASLLADESKSMSWITPIGMPIIQRYTESVTQPLKMWLYRRGISIPTASDKHDSEGNILARIEVMINTGVERRIEKKRMRSASSPNVIHSMDGAHLQRSVALAKYAGIVHFFMIHDAFGTHAGNMHRFGDIVRDAFVKTYEDYCPLAELDRYARSVLSDEGQEKLPAIPVKGTLDLSSVRDGQYSFA